MKRFLATLLVLFSLALGSIAFAGPAAAAECRVGGTLCGKVYNVPTSHRALFIGKGYPVTQAVALLPGRYSTSYFRDTDAVKAPAGCSIRTTSGTMPLTYPGGYWIKISDTAPWDIRQMRVVC